MNERYEIRRKIGQGGLGTVYQAFDSQLKRDVAIKRLFAPVDGSGRVDRESAAEKLMREATALSRLNHPNIVSIFDVGVDADGGFVVMELLSGETLTETISKGTLTLKDLYQVVYQTLEALIAAEAQNILHRDLKPSNIMLIWLPSGRFLIKVLDFGLAKVSAQPALQTIDQNNSVLGSIFYMAPEQFERRELDFSTDLYSMGCIYYFCLAGKDPFTGRSVADVMNAHLEHRVVPLHEVRPDLPPDVCDWVMWLLRRDMHSRPPNAKVALTNFPLIESSGGAVEVKPERSFVIPGDGTAGSGPPREGSPGRGAPAANHPSAAGTASGAAASGSRLPTSRTSGPVPSRGTAGNRLPPSRSSGPIPPRATTGTRVPGSTSGPVPTRTTSSNRLPPVHPLTGGTGAVPTETSRHGPAGEGKRATGFPLWAGAAGLLLVAGLVGLFTLGPGRNGAGAKDALVPAVSQLALSPLGDGDELQLSFRVTRRSPECLRFALIQPEGQNSKSFHGYAFDIDERQPLSLTVRSYTGEPASRIYQVLAPGGKSLKSTLSGKNVTASQVSKVELRGKLSGQKNLAFTVTLWNSAGEKGVYTAKDPAAALTGVQAYGFRARREVIDAMADQKFAVARAPKSAPATPAPVVSDPAALGLTVLLDDDFDGGAEPSIGNDPALEFDGAWQQSPWLAKPEPAKKFSAVNGTNAVGISANRSSYSRFPSVELVEGRLIEAAFACRIEDQLDSLRILLVNREIDSRGYLVEFGRNAKIMLYELRGQNGKDFPLEVCRQIHEWLPSTPPPRLSQASQVRVSVTRLKGEQARVQITANLPGGKTASTSFVDPQAPTQFGIFGVKVRGKKGKLLMDNVRIVSTTAPAG